MNRIKLSSVSDYCLNITTQSVLWGGISFCLILGMIVQWQGNYVVLLQCS